MEDTLKLKAYFKDEEHFMDIANVEEAMKVQVSFGLKKVFNLMSKSTATKKDMINSLFALDIVKASQDHIRFINFLLFKDSLKDLKCQQNRKNLELLCILYGLNFLNIDCTNCYISGYFPSGTSASSLIVSAIKKINLALRPKVLNILEAFEVSDMFLQSAIGNSYGDIYEQHLEWAKDSRLNHTKAGHAIPDGYMEHIMPILKGKM